MSLPIYENGPSSTSTIEKTMKKFSIPKFILAIYIFSWICFGIAIATGQPSKTFPTIIFHILGGSGPSLVALFYLFRNVDKGARRDFWSRLIDVRRIDSMWWFLTLFALPLLILLAVALDVLLGNEPPALATIQMLIADPISIPIFILIMIIGGALSEELGWRGLLLDAFQQKWTPLLSTLVLSIVWWAWHLPLFSLLGTTQNDWGWFSLMFWLLLLNVIPLTAFLTLAYNHTGRSILSAVLIHFSYNLTLGLVYPFSARTFAFLALFTAIMVVVIVKTVGWGNIPSERGIHQSIPVGGRNATQES